MDSVELTVQWEGVFGEACQWKMAPNSESHYRGRPAELGTYSLRPVEDGWPGFAP